MGHGIANVSVSALMFDYVLTGPISARCRPRKYFDREGQPRINELTKRQEESTGLGGSDAGRRGTAAGPIASF